MIPFGALAMIALARLALSPRLAAHTIVLIYNVVPLATIANRFSGRLYEMASMNEHK